MFKNIIRDVVKKYVHEIPEYVLIPAENLLFSIMISTYNFKQSVDELFKDLVPRYIVSDIVHRDLSSTEAHQLTIELADKLASFYLQMETKAIKERSDYMETVYKSHGNERVEPFLLHEQIKTLYNALTLSDKPIPSRIEQYSLLSIKRLKEYR